MKLVVVILTTFLMQVSAAGLAQTITLKEKETPLKQVLQNIRTQTGYDFLYDTQLIEKAENVNINLDRVSLDNALNSIFEGRNLTYTIKDKFIVIKESLSLFDRAKNIILNLVQDITVRGVVKDEDGKPLPNASIRVKSSDPDKSGGKNTVINTNQNGEFEIRNVADDAILLISYVGYKTLEIPVKGAVMPLEIKLELQTGELEEVNVTYNTGYQTLPKERATGSFNQISNPLYNEQVGANALIRLPLITNSVAIINAPGVPNQLTVRGLSTFSGPKNPLIVLDNFPYEGDINNINPNDIENITVLKDAAAASIWGARAGNGVIVITTKKGAYNQNIKTEIIANVTLSQKPDLFYLKRISTSDFIDVENFLFGKGFYDSYLQAAPFFYQTPVVDILEKQRKGAITANAATAQLDKLRAIDSRNDYLRYMYNTGVNQQYAANMRGGSANHSWIFSVGNDRNKDNLAAEFNRYTLRLDNTYRPAEKLELQAGLYYTDTRTESGKLAYNGIPGNGGKLPYIRFKDENGAETSFTDFRQAFTDTAGRGYLLDWRYHPLQDYKHSVTTGAIQSLIAKFGARYSFLKWLSADLKYQYEKQTGSNATLNDEESYAARNLINQFTQINYNTGVLIRPIPLGGVFDQTDNGLNSQNIRGQLNIDHSWNKHMVTAILGSELRDIVIKGKSQRLYGYNDEFLTFSTVDYSKQYTHFEPAFGRLFIPAGDLLTRKTNRFVSFYGNAAYTYDKRYTFSISGRKDASNLFGVKTNDKWRPLWSTGIAWTLSNESFYHFKPLEVLTFRATYGFSGNVSPNMSSQSTINYRSDKNVYTTGPIAVVNNFYNPELRWEKVGMLNLGVDFKSAGNILSGSIEYFRKKGTDLYGPVAIDRTLGLATPTITKSYANLTGQGLDMLLNSNNLRGTLKWSTNFNFSYYKDKVTKYLLTSSPRSDSYVGGTAPVVGYPRFALFRYKWAGLNPNTGDPQGYVNGKISTNYRALKGDSAQFSDLVYKGNALPTFFGSLGNEFNWKGVSLNVRISYQLGYYFQRESLNYDRLFNGREGHADYAKRWQKPGDEQSTNVPSMVYPFNANREYFYQYAEVLTEKADHIRLEYVRVGYDFSGQPLRKMPFSKLRIFVMANELGILWRANKYGIDPLYTGNHIPVAKSLSIGINANL